MPRYFFDTTADGTPVDAEGETLPNDAAACASAVASLSELLPGRACDLLTGGSFGVTVAREDGTVFYRIEAVATEL